jgi:hypothetical protein
MEERMDHPSTSRPGTTLSAKDAGALALAFLRAMEDRDLAGAQAFLAPGARLIFPGGVVYASLDDLVTGSARKYASVRKRIEALDVVPGPDQDVAYVFGTLYGRWRDDSPFEGIRFIDRFTIRAGRIVRQDVWNDSALVHPTPRSAERGAEAVELPPLDP